jgi:hypothetical protein
MKRKSRSDINENGEQHSAKKSKALLESDGSTEGDSEFQNEEHHTSSLNGGNTFSINEEYAKRYEHNKKREERQRRKFSRSLVVINLAGC